MADPVVVAVGIGELRASRNPSEVLVAYGLGSCVGLSLYDPEARVAGLAHIMLPDSEAALSQHPLGKFANRAVPMLLEEVGRLGGRRFRLRCKIAGGAQMLSGPGFWDSGFNVGERNVEAVRAALERHRVPLLRADTGGNRGRTMSLFVSDGRVMVRIIGQRETEL